MTAKYLHLPSSVPITDQAGRIHPAWLQVLTNQANLLNQGVPAPVSKGSSIAVPQSTTLVLARLTPGGHQGSITITGGVVTAIVPST